MIRSASTAVAAGFLLLVAVFSVFFPAAALASSPDNLKGHWAFDEGGGSIVYDSSMNGFNGTIAGAAWTRDFLGRPGQALGFDANSSVTVPFQAGMNFEGPFSVCAWVRPQDINTGEMRVIVSRSQGAGQFSWALIQDGASVRFRVSGDGTWDGSAFDGEAVHEYALSAGRWTQITAVWNGLYLSIYINGEILFSPAAHIRQPFLGTSPITIGVGSGHFLGAIDEVRIYSAALSREEIREAAGLTSQIHGRLTRDDQSPVSFGWVTASPRGNTGFWMWAMSDIAGDYTMYVAPGCYSVNAGIVPTEDLAAPAPVCLYAIPASSGGSTADFVYVTNGIAIRGRITANGIGIPGMAVQYGNDSGLGIIAVSDANGDYTLTNLPFGKGRVKVYTYGSLLAMDSREVLLESDLSEFNFYLSEGATVTGLVISENGTPVPGAAVTYSSEALDLESAAETGADGHFVLSGLPSGIGRITAIPPENTNLCASPELVVNLFSGQQKDTGSITLVAGALVTGIVRDQAQGMVSCLELGSEGLNFSASAVTCNGEYRLMMPIGTHYISTYSSDFDATHGSCVVAVTITAMDIAENLTVYAPDFIIYEGESGGRAAVTVSANPDWVTPAEGGVYVAAFPAGFLSAPFDASDIAKLNASRSIKITSQPGFASFMPMCPGLYDFFLVWNLDTPDKLDQVAVLDKALNVSVADGQETPVALNLPGANVTRAAGMVYDDNGLPVVGATVFITGTGGVFAGFATTDGTGAYAFYGLAASDAGTPYTVTALKPGYAGQASVNFVALKGGTTNIPAIDLAYPDVIGLTVRKNFHVETTRDTFNGADNPGLPVQPRGEVWFSRALGSANQIQAPDVDWMPGQPVENVFAQHTYMPMTGGPQNDALPPGLTENPNSPACRYKWTDLPSLVADGEEVGLWGVSSDALATSMPLAVTRTFDGPALANPYQRWVTVAVSVNETGINRLDIDIFDKDSSIALANFNEAAGMMEGGVPVDSENYQPMKGFFRRSIANPVPGVVYVYRKLLDVQPQYAQGAVEYVPETRVRVTRSGEAVQTDISGNTITITDPAGIGVFSATPQNEINWNASQVYNQTVHEVVQTLFTGDTAAFRPAAIDLVPQADRENASTGTNVSIAFNKPMNTASVGFRLEDQWGNVVHDSWRGIIGGTINWSSYFFTDDTFTFTPSLPLNPGTAYRASWYGRDVAGYEPLGEAADQSWIFTTAKSAETVKPFLVSNLPADGATGVPVSGARKADGLWISAFLNEAVKPSTLSGAVTLDKIDGPGGAAVQSIPVQIKGFGHRVTILPNADLEGDSWYRVTLGTGIRDIAGNAPAHIFSWEFETGPANTEAPAFLAPFDGVMDIDPVNPAILLFPERDLDPASLIPGSVAVRDSENNNLTGFFQIEYRRPDHGLVLVKSAQMRFAQLEPGETYTVSLTPQVKDLGGISAVPAEFSFTTAAGFANRTPQFRRVTTGGGPWPDFTRTPAGYNIGLDAVGTDRDFAWPGETLSIDGYLGDAMFSMDVEAQSPYYRQGDFPAHFRTPANSPVSIEGGEYNLGLFMTDSAGNSAIFERGVMVFGQVPALLSPANNSVSAWPPKLSFGGIPGAKAYVVQVFADPASATLIGSFPVADDGRSGSYSLTLPDTLSWSGQEGWWRVTALGGLDPNEPWGRAVSEVRSFVKDAIPPYLAESDPQEGSSTAGTSPLIRLAVADADSIINTESISVWLDGTPVPGASLAINSADPKYVWVSFTPSPALAIGSAHNVRIYCMDGAGNPIAGTDTVNFSVRENTTLEVPNQYPSIGRALLAAVSGDTILVHPGTYHETLELDERHSGIRLVGENPETTILEGDANYAVVTFFGTDDFLLKGFTIINGGEAGVIIAAHSQGTVGNTVSGCRITENIGDGVIITANEANVVENNLIFWNGVSGVYAYDQNTGDVAIPQPVISFNTIADNNYDGVNLANCNAKAFYNILAVNGRYGVNRLNGSPSIGRNIVWGNDDGNYSGIAAGVGDISSDPMFVDRDSGDYRPGPTSPAKDALDPISVFGEPNYVGIDIRGVNRPVGGRYDTGCYELRDSLTAPVAKVAAPVYYAMEGRPFCLEFNASWETATDPFSFTLIGSVPAGMTFDQPVYGASKAWVNWTPASGTAGSSAVLVPQVSSGTSSADGQAFTITVLPPLALSPLSGTAFIYGTTAQPINLNITGGTSPYHVSITTGDGVTASLAGLTDGMTDGAFTLVPIAPTGAGVDPVIIRVTDSTPAYPETFSLVSGSFNVVQINKTLGAVMSVENPGIDNTMNVASGDFLGWSFYVPAGAASAPFDLSASRVLAGWPYLYENSTLKALVEPEGMAFSKNVVVGVPVSGLVGGGAVLNSLVALTYDSLKSRWTSLPVLGRDATPGSERLTFSTPHFSLFTVAAPSTFTKALSAGTGVVDYRLVCFPAYAASSYTLTELLAEPSNLGAYDDRMWRLFGVDNERLKGENPNEYYVEGNSATFGDRFPLEPGRAFWVISRAAKTVSVPGLAVPPESFYLRLVPGWNMVGNPFPEPVMWNLVERSLDGITFVKATDAYAGDPLKGEVLYGYDPPNAEPGNNGYLETGIMEPNTGYWVYNPQKQDVIIRIPVSAFGDLLVGANEKDAFIAAAARVLSKGVAAAFADSLSRTPPSPPGVNGANAGSADAIGAGSVASGGSCFVETVTKNSSGACWLLSLAALAAIAGIGIAHGRLKTGSNRN